MPICQSCGERVRPTEKGRCPNCRGRVAGSPKTIVHTNVVVQTSHGFPHFIHGVLTLFTCGLWFPVWIVHYLLRR